jgi:hypothetical protein
MGVPSLVAQDLVHRATGPQLGRWQEQVAATGYCAHPIRLTGRTMHVDQATGEVREVYDTADEPDAARASGHRRRPSPAVCHLHGPQLRPGPHQPGAARQAASLPAPRPRQALPSWPLGRLLGTAPPRRSRPGHAAVPGLL